MNGGGVAWPNLEHMTRVAVSIHGMPAIPGLMRLPSPHPPQTVT